MGQREDVQASLMRGDSRDGVARRKLATDVAWTVAQAAGQVGAATSAAVGLAADGKGEEARAEVLDAIRAATTAASAVVLASDLRAPVDAADVTWSATQPGWRPRLVNVERLLVDALSRTGMASVDEALAEVRALLDGRS